MSCIVGGAHAGLGDSARGYSYATKKITPCCERYLHDKRLCPGLYFSVSQHLPVGLKHARAFLGIERGHSNFVCINVLYTSIANHLYSGMFKLALILGYLPSLFSFPDLFSYTTIFPQVRLLPHRKSGLIIKPNPLIHSTLIYSTSGVRVCCCILGYLVGTVISRSILYKEEPWGIQVGWGCSSA